jgi:hypothetical protein
MSVPTQEDQRPRRVGGKGRPIAFLIAAIVGLGGLGVAAGMALGAVGAASPSPAVADYDCPGRAGGYGGPGYGPGPQQPGTP